ncbi:MAG: hypothetical protein WAX44_02310 [Minisyncoccia bacterium]
MSESLDNPVVVAEPTIDNTEERSRLLTELAEKLEGFFYDPDQNVPGIERENYVDNLLINRKVIDFIEHNPGSFDLFFIYLSRQVYDKDQLESLLKNIILREAEKTKNQVELVERLWVSPLASVEEYELGVYKEQIESQVRDAVLELKRKGYRPFGSGFGDLVSGTQAILLNKEGVEISLITENLRGENVEIVEEEDRIQIIFKPTDSETSMEELKKVWNRIVSKIPSVKDNSKLRLSDNGRQGSEFRETQNKIKKGQNAWLRNGLAFVDGKVVEMSYEDFQILMNK